MLQQISRFRYECLLQQTALIRQVMSSHVNWLTSQMVNRRVGVTDSYFPNDDFNKWYQSLVKLGFHNEPQFLKLVELKTKLTQLSITQDNSSGELEHFTYQLMALHQAFFELLNEFSLSMNMVLNMHDYLTLLPNRKLFEMVVDYQDIDGCLIMADIDHFKKINDQFGHDQGDSVLEKLGSFFLEHTDENQMVSRYGGEEFLFYLPKTSLLEAEEKAEQLRQGVASLQLLEQPQTCSFGVCGVQGDFLAYQRALCNADHALYQAKNDGRNCVRVHSS